MPRIVEDGPEIAVSAEGEWVALWAGGRLSLHDTDRRAEVGTLSPPLEGIVDIGFTTVGAPRLFVVGRGEGGTTVVALTVPELAPIAQRNFTGRLHALAVVGERILLVSNEVDDAQVVTLTPKLLQPEPIALRGLVRFAAEAPEERLLIDAKTQLEFWDPGMRRALFRLNLPLPPAPKRTGFASRGRLLWVADAGGRFEVFRFSDGRPQMQLDFKKAIATVDGRPQSSRVVLALRGAEPAALELLLLDLNQRETMTIDTNVKVAALCVVEGASPVLAVTDEGGQLSYLELPSPAVATKPPPPPPQEDEAAAQAFQRLSGKRSGATEAGAGAADRNAWRHRLGGVPAAPPAAERPPVRPASTVAAAPTPSSLRSQRGSDAGPIRGRPPAEAALDVAPAAPLSAGARDEETGKPPAAGGIRARLAGSATPARPTSSMGGIAAALRPRSPASSTSDGSRVARPSPAEPPATGEATRRDASASAPPPAERSFEARRASLSGSAPTRPRVPGRSDPPSETSAAAPERETQRRTNAAPALRTPGWRGALADWGRNVLHPSEEGSSDLDPPPLELSTPLGLVAHRFDLAPTATRALTLLYAAWLLGDGQVGLPATTLARLISVEDDIDWQEALGRGALGGAGLVENRRGRIRLRRRVGMLLDGFPPRVTIVRHTGDAADPALATGIALFAVGEGEDAAAAARRASRGLGRDVAVIDLALHRTRRHAERIERDYLEARIFGALPLVLDSARELDPTRWLDRLGDGPALIGLRGGCPPSLATFPFYEPPQP